jgi:hypothetical protein
MAGENEACKEIDHAILYINDAIRSILRATNSLTEEDQRASLIKVSSALQTKRIELQLCKEQIEGDILV